MSLATSAWLASRDLRARWPRVLLAAVVVAVLSGVAVTLELLGRAREEAVAMRVDAMGPPLSVVPAGTTAEALGRLDLGGRALPDGTEQTISAVLGASLRRVEPRLVVTAQAGGIEVPLIGLAPPAWGDGPATGLVVGAELGRRFRPGTTIEVGSETLKVARVAQEVGGAEDAAFAAPLALVERLAGRDTARELRVYLRAGVDPGDSERSLRAALPAAAVVRHDRGPVAASEVQTSLAAHRHAAYVLLAVVALLCLAIAAQLDAAERRVELATLSALGAPGRTMIAVLVLRACTAGIVGATAGAAAATSAAALQDPLVASAWLRWWPVGVVATAAAVGVALLAGAGVGALAALRDPVADLQEG